jgi:hypothetical protein
LSGGDKERRCVRIRNAGSGRDGQERRGKNDADACVLCHRFDYSREHEKIVNRGALLLSALALLGAAPPALVAGSIRDQHGAPIGGALVRATAANGQSETTVTAADGTFALEGDGISSVSIACRYCVSSRANVAADGTVIAIVRRYDALIDIGPSALDIASLPYARAESAIALTPFTILENSRSVVPGPQVGVRVIQPGGGLLVDGGIQNYDSTSSISPYLTTPYAYATSASTADPSWTDGYGDRADGGTVLLDTRAPQSDVQAIFGTADETRASLSGILGGVSAGYSSDPQDRRQRADAQGGGDLGGGSQWAAQLTAQSNVLTSQDDESIGSGFSGAGASYRLPGNENVDVNAVLDRGEYAYAEPYLDIGAAWSDAGVSVAASPRSGNGIFADAGARTTAGLYDADVLSDDARIAAHLGQVDAIVGDHFATSVLDLTTALSAYHVGYTGGTLGVNAPASEDFLAPLVRAVVAPQHSPFSLTMSASSGYSAPTFLERYGAAPVPPDAELDRDGTYQAQFEYSDGARVNASVFALTRNMSGLDTGFANAFGTSVDWQIAPQLSMRAWWMHAGFGEIQTRTVLRFGSTPKPSDVGSLWLSYEAGAGIRIDAIWRRDLVDWDPDAHLDGAVSGPLARRMRWFVGSERYIFARSIEAGIRYGGSQ